MLGDHFRHLNLLEVSHWVGMVRGSCAGPFYNPRIIPLGSCHRRLLCWSACCPRQWCFWAVLWSWVTFAKVMNTEPVAITINVY